MSLVSLLTDFREKVSALRVNVKELKESVDDGFAGRFPSLFVLVRIVEMYFSESFSQQRAYPCSKLNPISYSSTASI